MLYFQLQTICYIITLYTLHAHAQLNHNFTVRQHNFSMEGIVHMCVQNQYGMSEHVWQLVTYWSWCYTVCIIGNNATHPILCAKAFYVYDDSVCRPLCHTWVSGNVTEDLVKDVFTIIISVVCLLSCAALAVIAFTVQRDEM